MTEKKYVLEWSRKQNGFHIQPLVNTLEKNQECFLRGASHDYIVLMVGPHDACSTMADTHRGRLIEREGREVVGVPV